MNFCSHCGADKLAFKIPEGDNLPRYCCENCHTIHYQNPKIIVGAICIWQHKILLAQRNIEPRFGFWNLPCGFLENNETVQEGALREVMEETGAEIDLNQLHTVYSIPKTNQVYLIFKAEMKSDFYKKTTESSDVALFAIHDIPWKEIAFSSNTFALKNFIDDLKNDTSDVHFGSLKTKN